MQAMMIPKTLNYIVVHELAHLMYHIRTHTDAF